MHQDANFSFLSGDECPRYRRPTPQKVERKTPPPRAPDLVDCVSANFLETAARLAGCAKAKISLLADILRVIRVLKQLWSSPLPS